MDFRRYNSNVWWLWGWGLWKNLVVAVLSLSEVLRGQSLKKEETYRGQKLFCLWNLV